MGKTRGNRTEREDGEIRSGNSGLYYFARGLDRVVNLIAFVLFALLFLYAGYSLWYSRSLQNESFLPDELAQYRPDGREPSLADLRKINPDVAAWIRIEGTNIDYPVVQGRDDSEYLNKSVLGEFSLAGSLFLSASNRRDFSDTYNMVYGHHIEGGAMLADVLEFRDASFFKSHPEGILWYPDEGGRARADRIEIFAVIDTGGNDEVVYADPTSVTPESLPGVSDYILAKAVQKREPAPVSGDRVIGLSTCENAVSFERVLLFGRLVPMTQNEIQKAQAAMRASSGADRSRGGESGAGPGLAPWVLPSAAAALLIILLYLIYLIRRRRREAAERGRYRR